MKDKQQIICVTKQGSEMSVAMSGSFNDVLNAFNGVCKGAIEGIKNSTDDKAEIKQMQIDLMQRYLESFCESEPFGVLILFDQFLNGLLDIVKEAENTESKKNFLETMIKIITKAFEDFKKDCEEND